MVLADRVAAELAARPQTTRELAQVLGCAVVPLRRLCRALARHGELEREGAPVVTGRPGRPARRWVLRRQQLALALAPLPPTAPTAADLVRAARDLMPQEREALLLLVERARTLRELRAQLALRSLRTTRDLLASLERRNLVEQVESRRPNRIDADRLYSLHPLFLTHFGLKPTIWRS